MSEKKKSFPDKPGLGRIEVRYLKRLPGVTARRVIDAARAALDGRAVRNLSVAIVDEATLSELHGRYLDDPTATDVLSFDLGDGDAPDGAIEGEVVVSADAAWQQARRLSLDAGEELLRYVIHGVLHLRGLRDDTSARRGAMRRVENRILKVLGKTTAKRNETQQSGKCRRKR